MKIEEGTRPNSLPTFQTIQSFQNRLRKPSQQFVPMSSSTRSRKYKMLSTEEKQKIVRECHYYSINEVSRMYGISINNICRWRKRCERKSGAGRKVHNPSMESAILRWIGSLGASTVITRQLIRKKAIELAQDSTFKASKGWFERFMNRNREFLVKCGYGVKQQQRLEDSVKQEAE